MHLRIPEAMRHPLNIAVVGGGLMGCGIAAKLASADSMLLFLIMRLEQPDEFQILALRRFMKW